MAAIIKGRDKKGRVRFKFGGRPPFVPETPTKGDYTVHRKKGFYSDEIPVERINLKATQTRSTKKAAKPTLPKMPWD